MQQILNICWPAVTVFQQRGNFCVTLVLCPPGGAVTAPISEYQLRLLSVSGPASSEQRGRGGGRERGTTAQYAATGRPFEAQTHPSFWWNKLDLGRAWLTPCRRRKFKGHWKIATPLYAVQVAQAAGAACVVMLGKAAACYSVRAKQCRHNFAISCGNFCK